MTSLLSQLTNPGAVLVAAGLDWMYQAPRLQDKSAGALIDEQDACIRTCWSIWKNASFAAGGRTCS